MEGTVLLAPVAYGAPAAQARRTTTHVDARPVSEGIGSRLGSSARLIDESIDELRALDR